MACDEVDADAPPVVVVVSTVEKELVEATEDTNKSPLDDVDMMIRNE